MAIVIMARATIQRARVPPRQRRKIIITAIGQRQIWKLVMVMKKVSKAGHTIVRLKNFNIAKSMRNGYPMAGIIL